MVGIDSSNIQTALITINPTKVDTVALATSIAGNQNANNAKIDVTKLTAALNDLAKGIPAQKATFAQIVDLMSKEAGGKDEFFTIEGLKAFRDALVSVGTPLDATKVSLSLDATKNKSAVSGETAVGVANIESNKKAIDAHLRIMLGMADDGTKGTALAASEPASSELKLPDSSGLLHNNLLPNVQDKLAQSWGNIDPKDTDKIKAYRNSDEYTKRVRALTLAIGTTNINDLVDKASPDSNIMQAIKEGVNILVSDLDAAKGFFGGYDGGKVKAALAKFVDKVAVNDTVKQSKWGQQLAKIKDISPKFFMLILNEERNPLDSNGYPQEAAWVINMIYSNGVSNNKTGGIPKGAIVTGGYDEEAYSKALESFLTFASQGTNQGFKFYSKEEIANNQNIFGVSESDEFWAQHPTFHRYMQDSNKQIAADDSVALMNKFLEDMRFAGLINIDDNHNYLFKFDEGDKLAAIAHATANSIEAKHGKGKGKGKERVIPLVNSKPQELADIYNGISLDKLKNEKQRIYSADSAVLKPKVTSDDVLGSLKFSSTGLEAAKPKEVVAQLMEGYYGKDVFPDNDNKLFSPTNGEDLSVVTVRVQAGLKYLNTLGIKDGNTSGLTVKQESDLWDAMNVAGEPAATGPSGAGGRAAGTEGAGGGGKPQMTQQQFDALPEEAKKTIQGNSRTNGS